MHGIITIAWLTLFEARRKRIVLAAFACGAAWLMAYSAGLYFIDRTARVVAMSPLERAGQYNYFAIMGLYAVNFLTLAAAILLPVDTLSGEIGSGVIETLASKPIRRSDIVLGKWLAHWVLTFGYLLVMTAGILSVVYVISGYQLTGLSRAFPLMVLAFTVLLTICIAGGTRLNTITNGIVAFGFFGMAFVGGLVETVGTMTANRAARDVGVIISLIGPTDALWRMAVSYLLPPVVRDLQIASALILSGAEPTSAVVWWSVAFTLATLWLAVRSFERRPL